MRSVLVLIYDCLRYDYFNEKMPKVRGLLKSPGWHILNKHWSVAHCSDPNFATILSGEPPWITHINTQMGPKFKQVSEHMLSFEFKKKGYFTWAIEPVKVPRFYHMFDEISWHQTSHISDLRLQALKKYLKRDEPFFGFVRAMDTHYPYLNRKIPEKGNPKQVIPLYRKAVKHVDKHAATFIRTVLRERPDTMIILGADHGELLGEHGEWDHLYTLFSILTHVPMAIYVPGTTQKTHNFQSQHTDLYPTILDWAGIKNPLDIPGQSLLRAFTSDWKPPEREFWMQGIGAGPLFNDDFQRIDPGVNRSLWRHAALIRGDSKIVCNQFGPELGNRKYVVSQSSDYQESQKLSLKQEVIDQLNFPDLPRHHVADTEEARDAAIGINDMVMTRLRELGYA